MAWECPREGRTYRSYEIGIAKAFFVGYAFLACRRLYAGGRRTLLLAFCAFMSGHGPHRLGRYNAQGEILSDNKLRRPRAVEKTRDGKVIKPTFPPRLEIPQRTPDSHFPTAPTAAGRLTQTGHVTC
jgi:hypothetical protein